MGKSYKKSGKSEEMMPKSKMKKGLNKGKRMGPPQLNKFK